MKYILVSLIFLAGCTSVTENQKEQKILMLKKNCSTDL